MGETAKDLGERGRAFRGPFFAIGLGDWLGSLDRAADGCGVAAARGEGELQLVSDCGRAAPSAEAGRAIA